MVSPENSEDGHQPPVADGSSNFQPMSMGAFGSMPGGEPSSPQQYGSLTFPTLPVPVPSEPSSAVGISTSSVDHIHHAPPVGEDPSSKRQKTSSSHMVSVSSQIGSVTLSTEQLAAAAAQAMQQGRGRKKSQAQVDRRRERNRILARRTRLRKKFFFESLQKEVMDLQRENVILKDLVKTEVAEQHSAPLLAECDAMEKMPEEVLEAMGELCGDVDSQDFNLVKSIQMSQHSFVITDPSLHDNPIVFASEAFLKLTGYAREQVLGRNCRFLQGKETNKAKMDSVRRALQSGDDVSVTIINYMADGTPFWNKLFIAALRDAQNNIVNYIGVLVKVAGPAPGDPEHGVKLPESSKTAAVSPSSSSGVNADSAVRAIEGTLSAAVAAASSN